MFQTLSQFYNSQEWKKFREGLIHSRVNPSDGVLYCQHSGKPLVHSYDIVAHHIKPLTMQNVNDFAVSLNPDNILIVSQQAHNEIHARFGYVTERKVYYVYGAPCSGKTTFVKNAKGNSDIVIDIDSVWQCLTGGERYVKPDALKTNVFAVRDCLLDMIRTRAGRWEKAFIIESAPVRSERERKIQLYGAEPIFIDTSRENCIKRLYNDNERKTPEQRKQWEKFINKWFEDFTE